MVNIARNNSGKVLLGDERGFTPATAVEEASSSIDSLLFAAASGELPSLDNTTASFTSPNEIPFGLPLTTINKLWGIGLNYANHADDLDENWPDAPASFMKPESAVAPPGGPIKLPSAEITNRVTAEAEIGVVIGRECSHLSEEQVKEVIAGYVPIIDMTAEDILEKNPRFLTRSKSFDSFIVIGPWITTSDDIEPLEEITVQTVVNGTVEAENTISNMRFDPEHLVQFHSNIMTLSPGDIISTGTPGAYPINAGDHVEARIDRIGTLEADVI